jgi:predicted O-linked N-acetylglucosamine transferase (SPINDLY family)
MSAMIDRKLQQARARLSSGDIASADALVGEVLRQAPRHPQALCLLGVARLMSGRAQDAIAPLQQVLAADPHHGMAAEHLGLAQLQLGRFAEAEQALRQAARLPGAPASVFMRLGAAILHQGRAADALSFLKRACEMAPADTNCLLNLGQAHAQMGDVAGAEARYQDILRLFPRHADALFNLGVLALNADRLDDARRRFEQAVASAPHHADACVNLGIVLQRQNRPEDASTHFMRALAIAPEHAAALTSLAQLMAQQGQRDEARRHYEHALRAAPGMIAAHEGLGALSLSLGRVREAVAHLRAVLRAEPDSAAAHARLAEALFQSQALDEAESTAQRAVTLDQNSVKAYVTLGDIYFVRKDVERALAVIRSGVERTGSTLLRGILARELKRTCDWDEWAAVWQQLSGELAAGGAAPSPLSLLYQPATPREQLDYTRRWCAEKYDSARQQALAPRSTRHRRPRIGYLSSDFHQHAVAYLVAEVLELHDRGNYEVFAFSFGPEDGSPLRARLRNACEHFIDIAWEPDDVAIKRIRDAEIDIIVDLKGHTLGSRTAWLARRLAPVQLNWLGYPGTMGAAFIDGIIADGFIIPPEAEPFYSERVLRMPHCYQPNDRKRATAEPRARAHYGLPEDAVVFCCFNQTFKISPEVFACWMRLLHRVPGSVLWLLEDNPRATFNLQNTLAAGGLPHERMIVAPRLPQAQHLARYKVADLALDTYPYTSHTTASDGLWNDCPLVGLCGETFASRVSGSILGACGLADLITYSLADYEALAFRLAADRASLDAVRRRVIAAKQSTPLFDSTRFARDLETIYSSLLSGHSR